MRRAAWVAMLAAAAYVAGHEQRRWRGWGTVAAQAPRERRVLYYGCPMHPAYRSDKPGVARCCNMALVPVYAEDAGHAGERQTPPGAVRIDLDKQRLIGVTYATVERRPFWRTVRATARVGPDETRVARVTTKLEGWVDEVLVPYPGARVRKDEPLMTVYHPQSLAAQQQFLDEVKNSPGMGGATPGAPVTMARRRLETLGLSDEEIDIIARVRRPMVQLTLFSPLAGVVLERNAVQGQKVTPEALYTIADLTSVWVTAEVFADDAAAVAVGQSAGFTSRFLPGRSFEGQVEAVLPQVEPTSRTVRVRLRVANLDLALKPGMYGEAEFRQGGARRLVVPREAVVASGAEQTVYVDCGGGCIEPVSVTVGQTTEAQAEVLRGLRAGQRVVASGHFLIDSESRWRTSGQGGAP